MIGTKAFYLEILAYSTNLRSCCALSSLEGVQCVALTTGEEDLSIGKDSSRFALNGDRECLDLET